MTHDRKDDGERRLPGPVSAQRRPDQGSHHDDQEWPRRQRGTDRIRRSVGTQLFQPGIAVIVHFVAERGGSAFPLVDQRLATDGGCP